MVSTQIHGGRSLGGPCGGVCDDVAQAANFEAAKAQANLGFTNPAVGALVLGNTLLGGSGMLGIPHAFAVAGWMLGSALLLLFGFASAFGCHLLQCSARKIGQAPCSFYTVANAAAPRWTWLIDGAVMVKCFGVATSYIIIVGDLAPHSLHFFGLRQLQRWEAITAGFAVAGALACFKNLSALRYTAACSLLIVLWTVVLLGLFFTDAVGAFDACQSQLQGDVSYTHVKTMPCNGTAFQPIVESHPLKLMKGIPVFVFAFTCHQNIFTVCNEVRNATRRRIDFVIVVAYLVSGLCFGAAALFGYATYGDKVQSDVLKGYPSAAIVELTRLLYSLLALFSYPLQVHPSRTSTLALWSLVRGPPGAQRSNRPSDTSGISAAAESATPLADLDAGAERAASRRFVLVTCVFLALSYAVAVTVEDLGVILGIVGATGSTMVSYILPGLVYMQAFPEPHVKRRLACGQFLLGCIIMPTSLVLLFL